MNGLLDENPAKTIGMYERLSKDVANHTRTNNNSFISNGSGASLHHTESMSQGKDSTTNLRFSSVDPNATYKLPADPWVIRVRWK